MGEKTPPPGSRVPASKIPRASQTLGPLKPRERAGLHTLLTNTSKEPRVQKHPRLTTMIKKCVHICLLECGQLLYFYENLLV